MTRLRRLLAALGLGVVVTAAQADDPHFDQTPDKPEAFGYKVNWFAVRTTDSLSVLNALGVRAGVPANWETGMAAAYGGSYSPNKKRWLFVSPPVKGWVFIVGSSLPYPVMHTPDRHNGIGQKFDNVFSRLSSHFSEVQFFGSYRVVGFVAWARAQNGRTLRVFAFGDGDVYANVGDQTLEEASLGFPNLNGLSTRDATERLFGLEKALPDEADVLKLAALWSLDPGQFPGDDAQPGLGVAIELPKNLGQ